MPRHGTESSTTWYQIGGFGAQTNKWAGQAPLCDWFSYNTAKTLFPPTPEGEPPRLPLKAIRNADGHAQITLGMLADGSSCLLVTRDQLREMLEELGYKAALPASPPAFPSSRFKSLSPITFRTHDQLKAKLKTYQPKINKKKYGSDKDRSQANEAFAAETNWERREIVGTRRSRFEVSRVFWRSIYERKRNPLIAAYLHPWDGSFAGASTFACTAWDGDKENVTLLDIGYSKITLEERKDGDVAEKYETVHLRLKENAFLKQTKDGWSEGNYEDIPEDRGKTEVLSQYDCQQKAQAHFRAIITSHAQDPSKPHILFVYDWPVIQTALTWLGVDTAGWKVGLDEFIDYEPPRNERRDDYRYREKRSSSPYRDRYYSSEAKYSDRERSPPPRRDYGYYDRDAPRNGDYKPRYDGDRNRRLFRTMTPETSRDSPAATPKPACAPIHVIDVRELFGTVTLRELVHTQLLGITLRQAGTQLGVVDEKHGWCAGLDAEYLYEAWQSLAGGPAIDERRKELSANDSFLRPSSAPASEAASSEGGGGLLDTEEAEGLHGPPSTARPPPKAAMSYDNDDDDDWY